MSLQGCNRLFLCVPLFHNKYTISASSVPEEGLVLEEGQSNHWANFTSLKEEDGNNWFPPNRVCIFVVVIRLETKNVIWQSSLCSSAMKSREIEGIIFCILRMKTFCSEVKGDKLSQVIKLSLFQSWTERVSNYPRLMELMTFMGGSETMCGRRPFREPWMPSSTCHESQVSSPLVLQQQQKLEI